MEIHTSSVSMVSRRQNYDARAAGPGAFATMRRRRSAASGGAWRLRGTDGFLGPLHYIGPCPQNDGNRATPTCWPRSLRGKTRRLRELAADLAAWEVARASVGRVHAVVRMDIDVGIARLDRRDQ